MGKGKEGKALAYLLYSTLVYKASAAVSGKGSMFPIHGSVCRDLTYDPQVLFPGDHFPKLTLNFTLTLKLILTLTLSAQLDHNKS